MKLSKSYLFKKSKSDEIISFTFSIIDICNQKTTRRVSDSPRYSCGLQSSLYTKNHRFSLKTLSCCMESLSIKKV
jgi:hypothetical protein